MAKRNTCPMDDQELIRLGFIPDSEGKFHVPPNNELPTPQVNLSENQPPQKQQYVSGVSADEQPVLPDLVELGCAA